MKNILIMISIFLLSSCATNKASNAIEELGEEVIKKKEGLQITLEPIDEIKKGISQ